MFNYQATPFDSITHLRPLKPCLLLAAFISLGHLSIVDPRDLNEHGAGPCHAQIGRSKIPNHRELS
jgi:hypothetical protein